LKPRRSILSVPGHVKKMHEKAFNSNSDVVMFDLEDSVPPNEKKRARGIVNASLEEFDWSGKIVSIRINQSETPFAYKDIVEIVEANGKVIDSLVLPKVDSEKDIHFVERLIGSIELNSGISKKIGLEASIESAAGLENISRIAKADPRLESLVFGIADYSSSIGLELSSDSGHGENEEDIYPGHRWHFELSRIVMSANANNLSAIDAPYGNFRDPEGLRRSAKLSAALGFDGKWAIHPDQIEIINQIYTPSSESIERAKKIIEAYNRVKSEGKGAVELEGKMIDQATIRLAEKTLARSGLLLN